MLLQQKLRNTLQWNLPVEQQLEALAQFDGIGEEELRELAATCHKVTEAGILIEYLGYERLRPYLPLFLGFLQDINWPAARGASNMLLKAGKTIIPEIKRVFNEVQDDTMWHYWLLECLVENFEKALVLELKPELLDLIRRADDDGVAIQALRILKEKGLLFEEEIQRHYQYLQQQYGNSPIWLENLEEEIYPDNA